VVGSAGDAGGEVEREGEGAEPIGGGFRFGGSEARCEDVWKDRERRIYAEEGAERAGD
jgi:hypothetical protein